MLDKGLLLYLFVCINRFSPLPLEPRDRGSATSLSSDFSVITEDSPSAFGNPNCEAVDLINFGAHSHAVW